MTYEQLQLPGLEKTESNQMTSPSLARASHVNRTHLRERVKAMVTVVTCGERLQDVSGRLNQSGSLVRIRPVCLPELINGTSSAYLPTLPRWGTVCRGEYGELATSERLTSESECSYSLLTPTASDGLRSEFKIESLAKRWIKHPNGNLAEQVGYMETFPTPCASEAWTSKLKSTQQKAGSRHSVTLSNYVAQYPTPTVCGNYNKKGASKTSGDGLATVVGGKLNPMWVEWLMGFPTEYTDLNA